MGQAREENFPQAKSANAIGRPVSFSLPFCYYFIPEFDLPPPVFILFYLLGTKSLLETQKYKEGLVLIDTLLAELKKLDDKMILTEVHLLESRVYKGIGNLAKAKVNVFA